MQSPADKPIASTSLDEASDVNPAHERRPSSNYALGRIVTRQW